MSARRWEQLWIAAIVLALVLIGVGAGACFAMGSPAGGYYCGVLDLVMGWCLGVAVASYRGRWHR